MVTVFSAGTLLSLLFLLVFLLALFTLGSIPVGQALRSIAPLAFIVVLSMLFNALFVQGGHVYLDWGWLRISERGIELALFMGLRLLLLLLAGSLLTLTTSSFDLTEAFEWLLSPVARLGLPAHEFAFVLGLALRFLPEFSNEFHVIRSAQISRGANLTTSPFRSGLASLTSLIVPLFASVFRHADTLSAAMDARCYHGAQGRTRLHPLTFHRRDAFAGIVLVLAFAATVALSTFCK